MLFNKAFAAKINLARQFVPQPTFQALFHELPIGRLSPPGLLTELRQQPVDRQKLWHRYHSRRRLVASPSPTIGRALACDPQWLEHHITAKLQKMSLLLHQDGFVSSLKKMPHTVVPAIECLSVNAV